MTDDDLPTADDVRGILKSDIVERLRDLLTAAMLPERRAIVEDTIDEIARMRKELKEVQDAWYGRCVIIDERDAEIERLRKRERRLAARVKQLYDIIQADRGPDFYIPGPGEAAA